LAHWRTLTWFVLMLVLAACREKGDSCEDCGQLSRPLLVVASAVGGELAFFNPVSGEYVGGGDLSGWAAACDLTQVGERLVVTDNVAGAMSIYSMPEVERLEQLSIGGTPIDLRVSANSALAHLITHNGRYFRISLATLIADTNMTGIDARRLRLRPPADLQTWITCRGDSTLRVVQAQGFEEVRSIDLPAHCTDLEFAPDGSRVYAALPGLDVMWVIDSETGVAIDTLPLPGVSIDLAISHDGRFLMAVDSSLGNSRIFDLVNDTVAQLRCGTNAIRPRYSNSTQSFFVICPFQAYVLRVDPYQDPPRVVDTLSVAAIPQCMALLE